MKGTSYKESIEEIEDIIDMIDNENLEIDDLELKVKRVIQLIKNCKKKLRSTEDSITKELDKLNDL